MDVNLQLVEQLKDFAKRGVKFQQAKDALSKSGWTEKEIDEAAEQFPYNVTDRDPSESDSNKAYGKVILQADVKKQKESFADDALSAATGTIGPTSTFESRDRFVTWDLGIPWWLFYGGSVLVACLAVLLKIPSIWSNVGFLIFIVLAIARRYPRSRD